MLSQLTPFGFVVGWGFQGPLNTSDNDIVERIVVPVAAKAKKARATVTTAPTGQAITIEIYLGTITTGVLDGAPIATITIAINAFYGEVDISPIVDWPTTKFAIAQITQVGSVVVGATAAITLECQVAPSV